MTLETIINKINNTEAQAEFQSVLHSEINITEYYQEIKSAIFDFCDKKKSEMFCLMLFEAGQHHGQRMERKRFSEREDIITIDNTTALYSTSEIDEVEQYLEHIAQACKDYAQGMLELNNWDSAKNELTTHTATADDLSEYVSGVVAEIKGIL